MSKLYVSANDMTLYPELPSSAIILKIVRDLSSEIAESMSCIVELVLLDDEDISISLGRNREI